MTRFVRCCAALFALSIAGCSVAESGPSGDAASEETPSGLAFDDGPAVPTDEVMLGLVRPATVVPSEISMADQGAVIVADLLYDGLTEPVGTAGRLRGGLATDWSPSGDGTTWTFTLDTDRTNAAEVVAHFERLRAESTSPTVAMILASVAEIDHVAGDQVRFVLTEPNGGFPWLLSGVELSVTGEHGEPTGLFLPEDEGDGSVAADPDDEVDPAGAAEVAGVAGGEVAADEVVEQEPWHLPTGDEVLLRSGVEGSPDVRLRWYETEREAYNGLTLGQVDATVAPAEALTDAATRFGVIPPARSIARFYGMNVDSGPLSDTRLRRAVLKAVDRTALAEETFSAAVFAADGVVAPTLAGYRLGGCGDDCAYDPEAAQNLVEQVTAEDGATPSLTVAVTGEEQVPTAERLAADLEAAGFAVTVSLQEPQVLAATIAGGEADLFAFGWVAGAGSIDAVVPQLFKSDSAANAVRLRSPEVDGMVREAAATLDDEQRWDLLTEAHDLAVGSQRVLPLAVAKSHLVAAPHAAGLVMRADGSIDLGPR